MPLTPRDRRTLMIGGGVLGVLLVGFLVMNLLAGGGGDDTIPDLPDITISPDGGPGPVSVSPSTGVSPIPVFTGRDPFSVPPELTSAPPTTTSPGDTTTTPPDDTTTTPPDDTTTTPPTDPGGESSDEVGGKTVVLLSVFTQQGEAMVQVEVDGEVFNGIGIGDTFDNGRYELRSVSGDCATFLYGDESFTLCTLSDK